MKILHNISTKRNLYLLPFVIALLAFAMPACDTTDSGSEEEERIEEDKQFEDGILIEVRELLGDSLITAIETELEVPIHRGTNPPDIASILSQPTGKTSTVAETEFTFLMKPYNLLKSNVPGDFTLPGDMFLDLYVRFSNQVMEDYTIDLDLVQPGISPHFGPGSFIIGDGSKFTVFGPAESIRDERTVLSTHIISGVVNEKGISSLHHAVLLIDDDGVSGLIPEGTGRSFIDGDGTVEIAEWPGPGTSIQQAPDMLENYRLSNFKK